MNKNFNTLLSTLVVYKTFLNKLIVYNAPKQADCL